MTMGKGGPTDEVRWPTRPFRRGQPCCSAACPVPSREHYSPPDLQRNKAWSD